MRKIHGKPPGVLGVQVRDVPAGWAVRGCEVLFAAPGSAAQAMGLVGARQRTDPVGDVITSLTDVTDENTTWPVPDCQALTAAMAHTRAGDQVVVRHYHRQVIWYLLSGRWVPAAHRRDHHPALFGNRIALTVNLAGPAGVRVILDTGGV